MNIYVWGACDGEDIIVSCGETEAEAIARVRAAYNGVYELEFPTPTIFPAQSAAVCIFGNVWRNGRIVL